MVVLSCFTSALLCVEGALAQSAVSTEYNVTHLAGGPGGAGVTNGRGLQARFNAPTGIWGVAGILYVADSGERTVRKIVAATGDVTAIATLDLLQCTSLSSRTLNRRLSIWADASHAYIGDSCLHVVYKVALDSGEKAVLAGQLQKIGAAEGPGGQALFTSPNIVWGDESSLYTLDSDRFVRIDKQTGDVTRAFSDFTNVIDIDGTYLYRAQSGILQAVRIATGETTSVGPLLDASSSIGGVWRRTEGNEDFIYQLTSENTIRRVRFATGEFTAIAGGIGIQQGAIGGWKDGPGISAQFYGLSSMWGDDEYLYVAEANNNTVRKVRFSTAEVTTLGGEPAVMGFVDGPALQARFTSPGFIWGDGNYVYVTESSGVIRRVRISDGDVSTLAGTSALPIYQQPEADGVGTTARFQVPWGIWGDGTDLYVIDRGACTVRKISIATADVTTLTGLAGSCSFVDGIGNQARLKAPFGIWGAGTFLYITDDTTVRRLNLVTRELRTVAGSPGAFGSADGAAAMARFGQTRGIWGDGTNLYVGDSAGTIRKISLSSGVVTTLPEARFQSPTGIWGNGTFLYVTDQLQKNIYRVRTDTGEATIIAGAAGNAGADDGGRMAARFALPWGIWGDGADLYVADVFNYAIRRLTPVRTGSEPALVSISPEKVMPGTTATLTIIGTNFIPRETSVAVNGTGTRVLTVDVQSSSSLTVAVEIASDALIGARTIRASQSGETSNPISFEVGERPDRTTKPFAITGRGSLSLTTVEQPGAASAGYARIEAAAGSAAPSGFAIYGYHAGGVLISEAAVPAATVLRSGRISFDCRGATRTGIAIVNPNDYRVRIASSMARADGSQFFQNAIDLAPGEQLARFLNEFPFWGGAPDIAGTFTFTATAPVSVIALRGVINERSEFLMSTLPVVDLAAGADRTMVFPHLADGGGWASLILLVNPTDQPIAGRLDFVSASGGELALAVDGQTGSAVNYSIPAKSSTTFATSGGTTDVRTGWIRMTPAAGNAYPSGAVIFSFRRNGVEVSEASVPAVPASSAFRLYVDSAGDFYASEPGSIRSGFAVANPGLTAAEVVFELIDSAGNSVRPPVTKLVAANGQLSLFVDQLPGWETIALPFKGVLRVSTVSPSGIAIVGLRGRYNERRDFLISTAQPVNENAATSLQMFFPHFVQSGGYTTEFVLFPGQLSSASGSIRFFSQLGQPTDVPLQ